jgi:hypothetical protein
MARVTGKSIDPNGIYEAVELMGRGMVALQKIGVSEPPKEGFTVIKITQETARKIGRAKQPGETLAQAFERLALAGLKGQVVTEGCA